MTERVEKSRKPELRELKSKRVVDLSEHLAKARGATLRPRNLVPR